MSTLIASLVAIALWMAVTPAAASAADAVSRQTAVVADGAWCWFQDPRAVQHVGRQDRTYIGYVTSRGDIEVVSIDNGTGVLTHTTLHPRLQADDHVAPGIVVAPNGTVAVFYSAHNGPSTLYRLSTRPEDISAFGPEQSVGTNTPGPVGYTYANPIYLPAENRTYLFFRGGDRRPTVTWTSDFVHWAPARDFIYPDKAGPTARPYVKYATNGSNAILIAFTDGHPAEFPTNSVYAVVLKNGVLSRVDGTPLVALDPAKVSPTLPGLPLHTNRLAPLYDGAGAGGKAWVHSAALDAGGHAVVAYATFPRDTTPTDTDHRYRYARWNGTGWTDREFARAGAAIETTGRDDDYSGGLDLDHNDPSTLYASRQFGAAWHVERWHTRDGGVSFDPPVDLTPGTTVKNVRPVVPWGPPANVQVVWMSGIHNAFSRGYNTRLLMQTTGPLPTVARISQSSPSMLAGQTVTVFARRVAGYNGSPVPGTTAGLWAATGAGPLTRRAVGVADSAGLVRFAVQQTATTRYQVRFPAAGIWGASVTPSAAVVLKQRSAVRISVDRTQTRAGQPVAVGMRVVDAATNRGLGALPVELWQTVDGRTWVLRVRATSDSTGLVRVTRNPTDPVTYQARFPGTTAWAPSVSSTVHVTVRR